MNRKVVLFLLFLTLFTTKTLAASYSNITVSEAKSMIDSDTELIILDVRTLNEYNDGHIRNARLIPHLELEGRLDELDVNDRIMVYCGTGVRSSAASQILVDNGFLHVFNMLAGITAWISAGYPVYVKHTSLQEAINNAKIGDVIFVSSGIYYESVIVNKSVWLVGEDRNNTVIDGSNVGTVVEVTADNVSVAGFTVQNSNSTAGSSYAGIKALGQTCNITDNHATNNRIGIFATSQRSRIAENIVDNNGQGIALYASSEATVEANNVTANTVGISLAFSTNNLIMGNSAMDSSTGGHGIIVSSNSSNNMILHNDLARNYHGIWMSSSPNNSILKNTMTNNTLLGIELANSSNTTIYHNNFINNPKHVVIDQTVGIWDSGSEGNFWSDHQSTDVNNDGIADTPYVINSNNTDNYPLMNLYWNPSDINHDLNVDMRDVGLSARAFGTVPGNADWNPHADITGSEHLVPDKKIDMRDIGLIANSYGETHHNGNVRYAL
jgi:parallel beta-helix repeat protein